MKNLKKLLKVVRLLGKMKLYELAKEMDTSSKDLLEKAKALGINIKSHLSAVSEEDAHHGCTYCGVGHRNNFSTVIYLLSYSNHE